MFDFTTHLSTTTLTCCLQHAYTHTDTHTSPQNINPFLFFSFLTFGTRAQKPRTVSVLSLPRADTDMKNPPNMAPGIQTHAQSLCISLSHEHTHAQIHTHTLSNSLLLSLTYLFTRTHLNMHTCARVKCPHVLTHTRTTCTSDPAERAASRHCNTLQHTATRCNT